MPGSLCGDPALPHPGMPHNVQIPPAVVLSRNFSTKQTTDKAKGQSLHGRRASSNAVAAVPCSALEIYLPSALRHFAGRFSKIEVGPRAGAARQCCTAHCLQFLYRSSAALPAAPCSFGHCFCACPSRLSSSPALLRRLLPYSL